MDIQPLSARTGETVVLETDFCCDVDDVAALSLLCGEERRHPGAFRLGAISCNVQSPFVAAAVKVVLSAWGREDVPVAVTRDPLPNSGNRSAYLAGLAARWRGPEPPRTDPLDLWRRVLADAPDGSVSVVSIGFFNNLAAALADDPALFRRKVRCIWAMAGGFGKKDGYVEFNVKEYIGDTRSFLRGWDGPIVFVGSECGESIMTDLSGLPPECDGHPLVEAFRHFCGPCRIRSSWDPITVDLAVHGENELYELGPAGRVRVAPDGATPFAPDPDGNARVLHFRAPDDAVSDRITSLVRRAAGLPPREIADHP